MSPLMCAAAADSSVRNSDREIVTFSVGGSICTMTRATLNRIPCSIPYNLAVAAAAKRAVPSTVGAVQQHHSSSMVKPIFVDADPDVFSACVRYLRTGTFVPPAALSQRQWLQQVEMLGFSDMVSFPLQLLRETDLFLDPVIQYITQTLIVMQQTFLPSTPAASSVAAANGLGGTPPFNEGQYSTVDTTSGGRGGGGLTTADAASRARAIFSQSKGFRYNLYPAYFFNPPQSLHTYTTSCDQWLSPPDESFEAWLSRIDPASLTNEPVWYTLTQFMPLLSSSTSTNTPLPLAAAAAREQDIEPLYAQDHLHHYRQLIQQQRQQSSSRPTVSSGGVVNEDPPPLLSQLFSSGRTTFSAVHPVLRMALCPTSVNDTSARETLDFFLHLHEVWKSCCARFDALWLVLQRLSFFIGHVGMDAALRYLREMLHTIAIGWNVECTRHACLDMGGVVLGAEEHGSEVLRIQPYNSNNSHATDVGDARTAVYSLRIYL